MDDQADNQNQNDESERRRRHRSHRSHPNHPPAGQSALRQLGNWDTAPAVRVAASSNASRLSPRSSPRSSPLGAASSAVSASALGSTSRTSAASSASASASGSMLHQRSSSVPVARPAGVLPGFGGQNDNVVPFVDTHRSVQQQQQQQPQPDAARLSSPQRQQQQQSSTNNNNNASSSSIEGWIEVSADQSISGRPPCQRSLHAAAVLNDSMYVFGGYDGLNRVNDFYEFHFPTRCWREIITLGGAGGEGGGAGAAGAGAGAGAAAGGGGAGGRRQPPPPLHGATVTATGSVPSARDRHAAVVHRNSFYVFGGFDGTSRVSDLYGFDADAMVWREVRPRTSATAVAPVPNNDGPLGRDVAPDNVVGENVAGGDNNNPIGLMPNNPANNMPRQPLHPPPSPRHSHAAVVHGSSMYVFGGYDGSYRSDFHRFDFDDLSWRPVHGGGRSPRARYRSTACVRGDSMILFGGHDGTRHLSDVHLFDFTRGCWSVLAPEGVPPLPRDSHVSVAYEGSMYVFGGSTGSAMGDTHELGFGGIEASSGGSGAVVGAASLGNNAGPEDGGGVARETTISAKWRQITPVSGGGNAVRRFCHVGAVHRGSFYVFGGYDGSNRLNDFVKYDLAADNLFETDIPPPTLVSDLRSFLDDEDAMSFADITLMVEGVPVRAHKFMLLRSPYFRAMFMGEMSESSQAVVNLELVRHSTFASVLEYLYTDSVFISIDSAMELFVAADLFGIPRLQAMCERKLLESMSAENAALIFHAADLHSAIPLRDKALGYILSNFEAASKTAAFEEMARSNVELVFEILKSR